MIYVTGDIHADLERFKSKAMKRLKKGDTLIVCGDFGFVWDGSKKEQKVLKWLGKRPYQILFVEGTHDNLDLLAGSPEESFQGGKARHICGNVWQLLRGEIYRIEDDDIFTFGGGESPDMDVRVEGETWWRGELPTVEELEYARENLKKHGNVVDYVITHSPSAKVQGFLDMDHTHTDQLGAFLDGVAKDVRYKHWYFGKYHMDKVIPPLHHMMYQEVLPIKGR